MRNIETEKQSIKFGEVNKMLSKKYYIKFAEVIGKSKNLCVELPVLIKILKEDNERFDELRFREAITNYRKDAHLQ